MKNFISVNDVENVNDLIQEAICLKHNPFEHESLGYKKTLGLIFFNPSLRTRLSTQKAAVNLGMNVMVMNIGTEGWALETIEGAVMNGSSVEHIKDAAAVMGEYCDIIGIRSFPGLLDREKDYSEDILLKFKQYSRVPIVSLESATLHPLQSLADVITITENISAHKKPKVVLCWAPHVKPLPQAVPNSFSQWMLKFNKSTEMDFVISHPFGYDLANDFTKGATITTNQEKALEGADFVYVKNWSSYQDYGKILPVKENWLLNEDKMGITNNAKIMHCLPVRREVELISNLIESENSLLYQQAANRVWAAQAVLKRILENQKEGRISRKANNKILLNSN